MSACSAISLREAKVAAPCSRYTQAFAWRYATRVRAVSHHFTSQSRVRVLSPCVRQPTEAITMLLSTTDTKPNLSISCIPKEVARSLVFFEITVSQTVFCLSNEMARPSQHDI